MGREKPLNKNKKWKISRIHKIKVFFSLNFEQLECILNKLTLKFQPP